MADPIPQTQYEGPMPDTSGDVSRYNDAYQQKFPNRAAPTLDPYAMASAALNTYRNTGITVPDDLAISQAQIETHLGTQGVNAENNPFNIGVQDKKTIFFPKTQAAGDQRYYDTMANHYLDASTPSDLIQNFVNDEGKRYASNTTYEKMLQKQVPYVKRKMADNG